MKNHQRMVIPTPIRGGGRKSVHSKNTESENNEQTDLKQPNGLPQPMRGGRNKFQRSGPSMTSQFFNQKMRSPQLQPSNSPLPGYSPYNKMPQMSKQSSISSQRGHRSINSTHSNAGYGNRLHQNGKSSQFQQSPNANKQRSLNSGSYW